MHELVEQRHCGVVAGLQVLDDSRRDLRRIHRLLDARFHVMHAIAEPHRAGHARAALDRVQLAHQFARDVLIALVTR